MGDLHGFLEPAWYFWPFQVLRRGALGRRSQAIQDGLCWSQMLEESLNQQKNGILGFHFMIGGWFSIVSLFELVLKYIMGLQQLKRTWPQFATRIGDLAGTFLYIHQNETNTSWICWISNEFTWWFWSLLSAISGNLAGWPEEAWRHAGVFYAIAWDLDNMKVALLDVHPHFV